MRIQLYRQLPAPVRRTLLKAYSRLPIRWRFGASYWRTRRLITSAESWNIEAIRTWQLDRLRQLVDQTWHDVPGYRRLWSAAGFKPGDLRTLDDFRKLPSITKADLSSNLPEFTSTKLSAWKRIYRTTAGSTGIPFGFHLPTDAIDQEWAFMHSAWERAGWKLGDRSAVLRGAWVGSRENFWSEDPHLGHLLLSTYELTPETWPAYRNRIASFGAAHLQAYPSAAHRLSDIVLANPGVDPPNFRTIFLGSENLYDFQRASLARAFPGSRLFSWYGHAEQAVFAPECERASAFHLNPLYGFTEILDGSGTEVEDGSSGEIVATSFWNNATPFIRYRTMDFATTGPSSCAACGRPHRLLHRIDGRLQEMIVSASGRWISMTAINMHSNVFDDVRQFQFHQDQPGVVTFRYVAKPGFSPAAERRIREALELKLGQDMRLSLVPVENIPLTKGGKVRFLDQELTLRYGDRS